MDYEGKWFYEVIVRLANSIFKNSFRTILNIFQLSFFKLLVEVYSNFKYQIYPVLERNK